MNKVVCDLTNCYGIQKLHHEFDFSNTNAISIYARNQYEIKVLEEVNIMTPENIHLNSFMYEPILDMDISELLNLYQKVQGM